MNPVSFTFGASLRRCCLLFSIFALLFFSRIYCKESTAETPFFPATYQYDGFEFSPTRFYVLTASGYREILPFGSFVNYDQLLKQEIIFENPIDGLPTQKIEFSDGSKVQISGTLEGLGTDPYTLEGTYTRKGSGVTLDMGLDYEKLDYTLNTDASKAFWNITSFLFSYKENGQDDYSPAIITLGISLLPATA